MSRAAKAWSRSKLGRTGAPQLTPKQYFYAGYHAALKEVKWENRAKELLAIDFVDLPEDATHLWQNS